MKSLGQQLKWQFVLLHKNNIISISLLVTAIYGTVLYFMSHLEHTEKLLVMLVLNDPSVIGYFFIALVITTEIKHQILPAIFVTPVNVHHYILSRVLSLAVIGLVCSLALPFFEKGWDFDILSYAMGSLGICLISALMGVIVLTFATEFLRFALLSIPVFLFVVNLPLLDYLGAVDLGIVKYFLPIQGCLELIAGSLGGYISEVSSLYTYVSLILWLFVFYVVAVRLFSRKIIHQ